MVLRLTRSFSATIISLVLYMQCGYGQSADTLLADLHKDHFSRGDSINMEVIYTNYTKSTHTATVQLWIQDIKTGRRWKYRYPLINGYLNASLKVDESIPEGIYAFNYLLQKDFFNLEGYLDRTGKGGNAVNYVMIAKNKQTLVNAVPLSSQNRFTIHNLLFQDSAFIIFSRPGLKNKDLLVNIRTSLDSVFTPSVIVTKIVTIGNPDTLQGIKSFVRSYQFIPEDTRYKTILPEIVVHAKTTRRLEEYEKENVTALFSSPDEIVLDGLGSDEMAKSPDLYTYISSKVGGLRLENNNETGTRYFTWRKQPTDIYINEIKWDPDMPVNLNPSDIAEIKIFRPGTSISGGSGQGGAIAIYTKTPGFETNDTRKNSFHIRGYTGLETLWK